MFSKPSRLQTLLLMLPTWGFAHAVMIFRVLPLNPNGTALVTNKILPFVLLLGLAGGFALLASYVAARRAAALGWSLPPVIALLIHVPLLGAGIALWLAATGDEQEKNSAAPMAVAGRLVVPFILGAFACWALTWGCQHLIELGKLPLGLKQTGGYFGLAIFAGLPFATGVSCGVTLRRAGGTFGQAIAASMTLIGTIILILCAMAMEGIICVVMAAPIGAAVAFLGVVGGYFLARTKAADKLATAARKMLGSLGFKKADLRIEVAVAELGPQGADAVRFLFCPNAGQDLLPLDQIASSGEAARVMLALKTVLAAVDRTPVLVFDEVDANVGGEIGAQVGRELAALGKGHQVFCVTHLPQVAALGQFGDAARKRCMLRLAVLQPDSPVLQVRHCPQTQQGGCLGQPFGGQNGQINQPRHRYFTRSGFRRSTDLGQAHRQQDSHRSALPRHTVGNDLTAHALGPVARNRQAQAQARKASRLVGAAVGLKHHGQLASAHARPSVAHGENQRNRHRPLIDIDLELDSAALSELGRVIQQVDQHLAQTFGIHQQLRRQTRPGGQVELVTAGPGQTLGLGRQPFE